MFRQHAWETGSSWAGEHGVNFTANGPTDFAKPNIAAFKAALLKRGGPMLPKPEFPGGAAIGVLRHIVVAKTDEEARRIAKPAFDYHLASLNWLRVLHGSTEFTGRLNVRRGDTYEECISGGMVIAGSPETVSTAIAAQTAALGINYLLTYLYFGTMSNADARRSLDLFAEKVMPAIARL